MCSEYEESELMDCIRSLVREATIRDGEEARESSDDDDEDFESNQEYQALMHEVEEKLLKFLEEQVKVVHEEKKNAGKQPQVDPIPSFVLPIFQEHAYPCSETNKLLPAPPGSWPQSPVMIRPTPGTLTKIRGIRYACERDYKHFPGFCAGCMLPINSGTETVGKALVVDFESPLFVGTLLMRMRDIPPPDKSSVPSKKSYFDNRKRRFQAIVKGKFKSPLKMSETVTGQVFSRRAGKLPSQWVVSTFIKFVSALAPQLEATIDGDNPRFLVPLAATAHTVIARPHSSIASGLKANDLKVVENEVNENLINYSVYKGSTDIEKEVEEPHPTDPSSIMQDLHRDLGVSLPSETSKTSISSRMKLRKKSFNSVSAKNSEEPCFSLDNEYTFEFYQHLLVFHEKELVLEMGRPIGKVPIAPATDGQPIKFMSAHKDPKTGVLDPLWSFDIWHASMYSLAKEAHEQS